MNFPVSRRHRRRCQGRGRGTVGGLPAVPLASGLGHALGRGPRARRPNGPSGSSTRCGAYCPSDVPVFTDACEMGYRMHTDWMSHGPRLFFYPSNYITLGWALSGGGRRRGRARRRPGASLSAATAAS